MKKSYDKAFKQMAVELRLSGKPAREVAEELGITPGMLNRWRREYEATQGSLVASESSASQGELKAENVRLKKELREARLEAEILTKVVSIFSKKDGKSMRS